MKLSAVVVVSWLVLLPNDGGVVGLIAVTVYLRFILEGGWLITLQKVINLISRTNKRNVVIKKMYSPEINAEL